MKIIKFFRNLFVRTEKEVKHICDNCEYQHDVDNCPSSFNCYSREDKPHFKERENKLYR